MTTANDPRQLKLYALLEKVKGSSDKILSTRDLSPDEITLAEELVGMKLLSKITTRVSSFYTYGVNGESK